MSVWSTVFIGAGVVGTTFGYLLSEDAQFEIRGFYSRSNTSSRRAVKRVGSGVVYEDVSDAVSAADLIFITTPDDAVGGIAQKIAAGDQLSEGAVLLHTSGALKSDVLRWPSDVQYFCASMHPLQSFANWKAACKLLPESLIVVEGDEVGISTAASAAEALGVECQVINPDGKSLYHAAACVASNYLVVLLELALSLEESAGLSRQKALLALEPLVKGTLQNIKEQGTVEALTGPVARGDLDTIKMHLSEMSDKPQQQRLYRVLGQSALEIACAKGTVDDRTAEKLNSLLKEEVTQNE